MEIIFTDTLGVNQEYQPIPASRSIPEWYKETNSYLENKKEPNGEGGSTGTIKRCMPVFDALNSGYLLLTHTDIWVSKKEDKEGQVTDWYQWPSFGAISFHPVSQALLHPESTGSPVPKWINPWSIKTPLGYSTLFTAPFHRKNIFTALTGIVDTDKYDAPVNIIFVLTNPNFEGLVPAGTPIAQVTPFKRNSWEMKIGNQKNFQDQNKTTVKLKSKFFDSYKLQFRQTKEYN